MELHVRSELYDNCEVKTYASSNRSNTIEVTTAYYKKRNLKIEKFALAFVQGGRCIRYF